VRQSALPVTICNLYEEKLKVPVYPPQCQRLNLIGDIKVTSLLPVLKFATSLSSGHPILTS